MTGPSSTGENGPSHNLNLNLNQRDGSPSSLETVQASGISSAYISTNDPQSQSSQASQPQQSFTSHPYSPPSNNSNPLPYSTSDAATTPSTTQATTTTTTTHRPGHRKRSSSIITVEKIETSHEEMLDQAAGFNANADWVNYKGAWVIHIVLILLAKILLDVVPGMEQDISWTIVNLGYIGVSQSRANQ